MEDKGDEKTTISDIRLQLASCRQKYSAKCQELLDKCATLGIETFLNFKTESNGLLPPKCSCSLSNVVKATSKNKKRMFSCCVHKDNTFVNRDTDYLFLNNRNEMFAAIYEKKDYAFTNDIFNETDPELDSLNNAYDLMNFLDKHFKS
ncbi:uncharacterized protein LOC106661030 isoform X1 [Cimex lectularius]|uniref:Uncharacterized protein n=1 Tax=Cimex lectularius TaxID=79782 RepID=A0A8I6R9C6_CIMLE|nr:uncharacterized protein LOC106661030 isoform X1 [Cimex lectularius]